MGHIKIYMYIYICGDLSMIYPKPYSVYLTGSIGAQALEFSCHGVQSRVRRFGVELLCRGFQDLGRVGWFRVWGLRIHSLVVVFLLFLFFCGFGF